METEEKITANEKTNEKEEVDDNNGHLRAQSKTKCTSELKDELTSDASKNKLTDVSLYEKSLDNAMDNVGLKE
eukprot:16322729-Heterocapsa_arctica.AAC.1